jgi:hypothetical protein
VVVIPLIESTLISIGGYENLWVPTPTELMSIQLVELLPQL